MSQGYTFDHAWALERARLAGLEGALDPGTREHLTRLGAGPGKRCLEIGAGGGSVAFWLAEQVIPGRCCRAAQSGVCHDLRVTSESVDWLIRPSEDGVHAVLVVRHDSSTAAEAAAAATDRGYHIIKPPDTTDDPDLGLCLRYRLVPAESSGT
jgi:hypothetical protein